MGVGTIVAAFTEAQAARLTGVSQRQLRYWASDGFFVPGLAVTQLELPAGPHYSFRDLVCLKVISALRNDAKIPLKELRTVKEKLSHLGDDMWATTTLYILGKRVVFDNPETRERTELSSGQFVLQIPLLVVTGEMDQAVRAMRQRDADSVGKIVRRRGVLQNQAVLAGTRIPVRVIKEFSAAGYSVEQILAEFPTLARADVKAALSYQDAA